MAIRLMGVAVGGLRRRDAAALGGGRRRHGLLLRQLVLRQLVWIWAGCPAADDLAERVQGKSVLRIRRLYSPAVPAVVIIPKRHKRISRIGVSNALKGRIAAALGSKSPTWPELYGRV